jgi:hypothetical protein
MLCFASDEVGYERAESEYPCEGACPVGYVLLLLDPDAGYGFRGCVVGGGGGTSE